MMKSIFLADSKMLDMDGNSANNNSSKNSDNEYIMVDPSLSFDYDADTNSDGHDTDSDLHEEDYDYCDDVISEGMQYDPCSFTFSLTEDMILKEAEQPSIQHILDEAHKSASQLVSAQEMPDILESSASDVSVQSSVPAKEKPEATETTSAPVEKPQLLTPQQTNVGGRMSNKKRRKKMKLLKKAAAAAKAAAALSCDVPQSANTTSTNKPKKSFKLTPSTRYQNRRVANVAVACATETLASYKAELKTASKKVH